MKVFCQRLILCVTFLTLTGLEFLNKIIQKPCRTRKRGIPAGILKMIMKFIIILSSSIGG